MSLQAQKAYTNEYVPFEDHLDRVDEVVTIFLDQYYQNDELCLDEVYRESLEEAKQFLKSEIRFYSSSRDVRDTIENSVKEFLKEKSALNSNILWFIVKFFHDIARQFRIRSLTLDRLKVFSNLEEYDEDSYL